MDLQPPWSIGAPKRKRSQPSDHAVPTWQGAIDHAIEAIKEQASNTPQLVTALSKLVTSSVKDRQELAAPFVGPNSIINKRVQPARRFATQQYSLDRVKNIAAAADASLNDLVLYLCGTALRKFLWTKMPCQSSP